MALEYFAFNSWTFINEKFMSLNQKIHKDDVQDFYFFHENVDRYNFYKLAMIGGAKYLLRADADDNRQRRNQRR